MDLTAFKLLIVDDDAEHREMWSLFLGGEGYRVETAVDGDEALRLACGQPFDVVLLDVTLPGIDGFEILARLRQSVSPDELPVIMTTANGDSASVVRGFDAGANDYVAKPLNPEVLSARIRNQLRHRRPNTTAVVSHPDSDLDVIAGTVLAGRYRVDRLIGHGGSGAVYGGVHLGHGGPVALKLLRSRGGCGHQRLLREGVSACRIDHPGAVEVLDFLVTEAGVPCLVMELLNGGSLDAELDRRGRLSPRRCAEILVPVCDVLTAAHRRGIIHRDVKPQNVFLHASRQGEVVKVLDFGIAKTLDDPDGTLTLDGSLIGTPAYLAPERLTDDPIDGSADVYSVGVMLYELLSGRRPFESRNLPALIRKHLLEDPLPLESLRPDLPPEIATIVDSTLAKDPDRRPSPAELARSFVEALAGPRIRSR